MKVSQQKKERKKKIKASLFYPFNHFVTLQLYLEVTRPPGWEHHSFLVMCHKAAQQISHLCLCTTDRLKGLQRYKSAHLNY